MVETSDIVGPHVHTPHLTDGDVLEWVQEHVTTIIMAPCDRTDGANFLVGWINKDGYQQNEEPCKSLRELAERRRDE